MDRVTARLTGRLMVGAALLLVALAPSARAADEASPLRASVLTSTQVAVPADQPSGGASETISAFVPPGALTITVAYQNAVLPPPVYQRAQHLYVTSGSMAPVIVTDTRGGDLSWSVTGQISDFAATTGGTINGENLGWLPNVLSHGDAQTVTPGPTIAPADGLPPSDDGSAGLKSQRTLAVGQGRGTSHVGADLQLNVPPSTPDGEYTATLTVTAI